MISPFHVLGAIDAARNSGNFLYPDYLMVECRIPMERDQMFVYQSPISRLMDGNLFLDADDLRGGVWKLDIVENLNLHDQTKYVRSVAEKDSLSAKDRMIMDCWLAGLSEHLYGTLGHPGIEMGTLLSPALRKFVTTAKNDPEYIRREDAEAKLAFAREILALMDRFPNADLDGDVEEKFTMYHSIRFKRQGPEAAVQTGIVIMEYHTGAERNYYDVLEEFIPVANLSEYEFGAEPCLGFGKFRIRGEEKEETMRSGPSM